MSEKIRLKEKLKKYQPQLLAVALLGINIIGASYFAHQYPGLENYHQLLLSIFGSFHVAGRVADIISTERLTKKVEEVESNLNINVPIYETNSMLPKRARLKDMLRPDIIALELGEAIPLVIFPLYGLLRGARSFYAVNRHERLRKSLIESTSYTK